MDLDIPRTGFSSAHVDRGTICLLREIHRADPKWGAVLDVGCGYGPIALFLRACGHAGTVAGIDRDALVARFAERNARLNGMAGCTFSGGMAYADAPRNPFAAVVCNLPAKAGASVHRMLLGGAAGMPEPSGVMWVVVVTPLVESLDAMLAELGAEVLHREVSGEHTVYAFRPRGAEPGVDAYLSMRTVFEWNDFRYELQALHGLPEFDGFSKETILMGRVLAEETAAGGVRRAVVSEFGQGHLAVLLSFFAPGLEALDLVSRDALALAAAHRNLAAIHPGVRVRRFHTPAFWSEEVGRDADLFVLATIEKEGAEVNAWKLAHVCREAPGTRVLVVCTTSLASRMDRFLRRDGVRATALKKRKSLCVLRCENRR